MTRLCRKCDTPKPLDEMVKNNHNKDGYENRCKICAQKHKIKYKCNKWKTDPIYKLIVSTSNAIREGIIGKRPNSKYYEYLGCSINEFKIYIESKFEPWMNWNNRGKYNGEPNYGWDIDHIIPTSSAKSINEAINLLHYNNTRPLCSYINRDIKN